MTFESNKITIRAFQKLIDCIGDYSLDDMSELHFHLYNEDYEYIYYADAKEDLEDYGVFDAIEKIKNYEQFNFGEVNTDFSDPCEVANMLFYIIGEEIIYNLVEPIIESYDEYEDGDKLEYVSKNIKNKMAA